MINPTDSKSETVQDLTGMTDEAKAEAWVNWVRSEINAALDIYLPIAKDGQINVKYFPKVIEVLETGPVNDNTKASGVLLSVALNFENPIDLTKPRME